jgi:hypothetical protein
MTTEQITQIRNLLATITEELKNAKTHVRGISAYRADHDGLAYATSKLHAATRSLRQSAEDLDSLAADLAPTPSSAAVATNNGHDFEKIS